MLRYFHFKWYKNGRKSLLNPVACHLKFCNFCIILNRIGRTTFWHTLSDMQREKNDNMSHVCMKNGKENLSELLNKSIRTVLKRESKTQKKKLLYKDLHRVWLDVKINCTGSKILANEPNISLHTLTHSFNLVNWLTFSVFIRKIQWIIHHLCYLLFDGGKTKQKIVVWNFHIVCVFLPFLFFVVLHFSSFCFCRFVRFSPFFSSSICSLCKRTHKKQKENRIFSSYSCPKTIFFCLCILPIKFCYIDFLIFLSFFLQFNMDRARHLVHFNFLLI